MVWERCDRDCSRFGGWRGLQVGETAAYVSLFQQDCLGYSTEFLYRCIVKSNQMVR